jgi:hypothetical protein
MKIDRVSVCYGELRTNRNEFSNTRHEVTLSATLEPNETARQVRNKLQNLAVRSVKIAFGDNVDQTELDIPF